ncbi:hypothetical protein FA95DRAFT_362642 [Auriscalpium vulgare]|uniref:Uncharacterized protein n=1 Tax=Auriscalpium vulgare TaxID=40419 RepID=A0ACB8RIB5_9AGAM|nr:hypothetical protein FA95DRAFT_362642 [Auriscalpium vulgare]
MNGAAVVGPARSLAAAQSKRTRPPTLSLATSSKRPIPTNTVIELETPVDDNDLLIHHFSPPASTSPVYGTPVSAFSSYLDADGEPSSDDLSKDLAVLEQLRRSVQKNLRLRPIHHSPTPPHSPSRPLSSSSTWSDLSQQRSTSPGSSVASPSSVYYTPISDPRSPPLSAQYIGNGVFEQPVFHPPRSLSRPIDPSSLAAQLRASTRPLLIDTRPAGPYLASHIKRSINMAIPSLILKRSRKPGGGFQSLDSLRQFITTEDCKGEWDKLIRPGGNWNGDIVVYDEEMNENDRSNASTTAWALLPVIAPLLDHGCVDYLEGGLTAARAHSDLKKFIFPEPSESLEKAEEEEFSPIVPPAPMLSLPPKGKKGAGLFQLDTVSASRSKPLPQVEFSAGSSPQATMPHATAPWNIDDATPSPPPSESIAPQPSPRRPSLSSLSRLNTNSAERLSISGGLPKLQVRTVPLRSATLAAPPMTGIWPSSPRASSPSHLNLVYSNLDPPGSARLLSLSPANMAPGDSFLPPPSPSYFPPTSPRTPLPPTPRTARPELDQPPTTEESFANFSISTILPNFLYLGPEIVTEEQVAELESLGVKRILNIAIECDDDHGLRLRERFERYNKIPMRDTVEEENIVRGVREACDILDDASLHSAPTYVHCKAGKSRSVTAVMAYLIHANHWTLSRAYSFVLERRKGISPNIGFVSELMNFEEQELGGKSIGVVKQPASAGNETEGGLADGEDGAMAARQGNYSSAVGGIPRRPGHMRESLPPGFTPHVEALVMGDVGQETEVRDASGRYRHARRAPVDENTLQPMRRVSKAGLETAFSM